MTKYTLPEPAGLIVGKRMEPNGSQEFFGYYSEGQDDGLKKHVFTAQQMTDAYQQGQRDMREMAAKAIDDGCRERIMTASDCMDVIRELPIGEI